MSDWTSTFISLAAQLLSGYWYLRVRPQDSHTLIRDDVIAEMQFRADLAVKDAKDQFNEVLDFSPDSIETVESVHAQIHESHATNQIPDAELIRHALNWGGYIG